MRKFFSFVPIHRDMSNAQIAEIHRWARELLGGRGYLRAMNDSTQRARIEHIADALATGQLDAAAVRSAFLSAESGKRGIDQLFSELEELTFRRMPVAKSREAAAMPSHDINSIKVELASVRNQMRELEGLVRVLVERTVLDASRIHGLEIAVGSLATNSGVEIDTIYDAARANYLKRRGLAA